ncbi:hypothetical protein ElyMa_006836500, partial [Elysia marginata]
MSRNEKALPPYAANRRIVKNRCNAALRRAKTTAEEIQDGHLKRTHWWLVSQSSAVKPTLPVVIHTR